ncbi:MAG: hypothetical protein HOE19_03105 [Candidatus Komeilibacteria bacterium]|jgi:chorismate mutase|nr:hypothetical protein [Candidatus Komeilibacteria bacterium]MBT4447665.1 hypothetical protein [Candidatus Komeilibacteria bacterium]
MSQDKIAKIREKIDEADKLIIKSLAIRLSLMEEVAKCKDPDNIRDFKREIEIKENITLWAKKNNIDPDFIKDLYVKIMAENLKKLKEILQK